LMLSTLLYLNIIAGNKTYQFLYDANGNRTSVTFISTCTPNRMAEPKDSMLTDTTTQAFIREIKAVTTPSAYPNPMTDHFILSFPVLEKNATLMIYDGNGNEVFKDDNVNTANSIIKTCGFPAGLYTIVVQYGMEKPFVQKMVKQ